MKLLIKTILLLSLCISLNAELKFEVKYGFLSEGTLLSYFSDAKIALKSWIQDIASDVDGKVDVEFYDKPETILNLLKKDKLDMVVFDLPFFFKNKEFILNNCDNFWSSSLGEEKFSQYYLVAKKSLKAKSFKDIKNKTISIKRNDDRLFIWLEKNSLLQYKKTSKKILKEISFNKKESTSLLNVFFNKSDFAIVNKKTWEIVTELNPAINKNLEIVKKSKKIHLPFIGFFKKGVNKESIVSFFDMTRDLKNLKNGEHIIELLKFKSIFRLNNTSLKDLTKYYDEYFALKKRYK